MASESSSRSIGGQGEGACSRGVNTPEQGSQWDVRCVTVPITSQHWCPHALRWRSDNISISIFISHNPQHPSRGWLLYCQPRRTQISPELFGRWQIKPHSRSVLSALSTDDALSTVDGLTINSETSTQPGGHPRGPELSLLSLRGKEHLPSCLSSFLLETTFVFEIKMRPETKGLTSPTSQRGGGGQRNWLNTLHRVHW